MKQNHLQDLQKLPWIGPAIAEDLWEFGLKRAVDFRGADAEKIYEDLCDFQQVRVHRCLLYILRCAVYFASNTEHDPALLKWWNWKDGKNQCIPNMIQKSVLRCSKSPAVQLFSLGKY